MRCTYEKRVTCTFLQLHSIKSGYSFTTKEVQTRSIDYSDGFPSILDVLNMVQLPFMNPVEVETSHVVYLFMLGISVTAKTTVDE